MSGAHSFLPRDQFISQPARVQKVSDERCSFSGLDKQLNLTIASASQGKPSAQAEQCMDVWSALQLFDLAPCVRKPERVAIKLDRLIVENQESDVLMRVEHACKPRSGDADEVPALHLGRTGSVQISSERVPHRLVGQKGSEVHRQPSHYDEARQRPKYGGAQPFIWRIAEGRENGEWRGDQQRHQIAGKLPSESPNAPAHERHNTLRPMPKRRFTVTRIQPGPASVAKVISNAHRGGTLITSLDEDRLQAIKTAFPDAEVLGFADLLSRVLIVGNLQVFRLATSGQVKAAVQIACQALEPEAALYRSGKFPGTHQAITEVVRELGHYGVDSEMLAAAASVVPFLTELALLVADIESRLAEVGRETMGMRCRRIFGSLNESVESLGSVLVFAGTKPKPAYERLLEHLSTLGLSVQLVKDKPMADLPGEDRPWYSGLFKLEEPIARAPKVGIYSAPEKLSECEWLLRRCLDLINEGIAPEHIVVWSRSAASYAPLLQTASNRLGVPLTVVLPAPLLTNGLANFVLRLLQALGSDKLKFFVELLSSSYLGLETAEQARLQDWVRLAAQSPDSWKRLEDLEGAAEELRHWLTELLAWRTAATSEPASLRVWTGRLRRLLEPEAIASKVLAAEEAIRERDLRALSALFRSLNDAVLLRDKLPDANLTLAEFAATCEELWDNETVVEPSEVRSGIRVVSSPERFGTCSALFVLDMLEGVLPRRRRENPILNDDARRAISAASSLDPPLPDSFTEAEAERELFLRLCAAPSRYLTFSYAESDGDRDSIPTLYLSLLQLSLKGRVEERHYTRKEIIPELSLCRTLADRQLREAMLDPADAFITPKLSGETAKTAARPMLEKGVTPEQLERLAWCPFQSVMRDQLRLQASRRRVALWGLTQAARKAEIWRSPDEKTALNSLNLELQKWIDEQGSSIADWEIRLMQAAARRTFHGWVTREFAARELWKRGPDQFRSAVPIEEVQKKTTQTIKGVTLKLTGTFDAVAESSELFLVHQYRLSKLDLDFRETGVKQHLANALYLRSAYGRSKGVGLEVETVSGGRYLYTTNELDATKYRTNLDAGLNARRLGVDQETLSRQINEELHHICADASDFSGSPRPTKEWCASCQFGEICRVSREFGEVAIDNAE